ncbi:MAG: hypothetical protein KF868_13830 [Acidobacteria bacterium]|nr:hypothetical protein [Acidobacteriota bacterium]
MRNISLLLATAVIMLAPGLGRAQSHEFQVEHDHLWRSCLGKLIITEEGIEYRTENGDHARAWKFVELKQIKIASPNRLELISYEDDKLMLGRDRDFSFKLLEGRITPEVSARLLAKSKRPLVTSVMPTDEGAPRFMAMVKHLHTTGGCAGTFKVFSDRMTFESADKPEHSRFWRYSHVQGISQSSRYRIEISSFENQPGGVGRDFNFQLKEELSPSAYDYIWARIYPSKFRRDAGAPNPASLTGDEIPIKHMGRNNYGSSRSDEMFSAGTTDRQTFPQRGGAAG